MEYKNKILNQKGECFLKNKKRFVLQPKLVFKKLAVVNKNKIKKIGRPAMSQTYSVLKTSKEKSFLKVVWPLLLIGLVIGFVNGLWGGGGGMLCVPTLTLILGMPSKKAHATAILVMLPLSICSFIVYLLKGDIGWQIAGTVTGGFVIGGIIGALSLKKINSNLLNLIFSLLMIAGAIKLIL